MMLWFQTPSCPIKLTLSAPTVIVSTDSFILVTANRTFRKPPFSREPRAVQERGVVTAAFTGAWSMLSHGASGAAFGLPVQAGIVGLSEAVLEQSTSL